MATYNDGKEIILPKVLQLHGYWLRNEVGGLRAHLQGADLQGANLQGADLQGASLQGASLQGADLQGADLQRTSLQDANLRGANLQGANLQGAYLQDANLRGSIGFSPDPLTRPDGGRDKDDVRIWEGFQKRR